MEDACLSRSGEGLVPALGSRELRFSCFTLLRQQHWPAGQNPEMEPGCQKQKARQEGCSSAQQSERATTDFFHVSPTLTVPSISLPKLFPCFFKCKEKPCSYKCESLAQYAPGSQRMARMGFWTSNLPALLAHGIHSTHMLGCSCSPRYKAAYRDMMGRESKSSWLL